MDGLNLITLSYLFFRLAPFIIVCYFSLSSVFNQDIKGLIYLAGLMLTCVFSIALGSLLKEIPANREAVCNMITIGNNGSFSKIPLGIVMLSYTLFYLVYIMLAYDIQNSNIPTLFLFSALIAGDIVWNLANNCYHWINVGASLIIGGGFGYLWGFVIKSIGKPNLLYLNVGSDQTVCSRPSAQLFKCTFSGKEKNTQAIIQSGTIDTNGNFTITKGTGIISVGDTFSLPTEIDDSRNTYTISTINGNNSQAVDLSTISTYASSYVSATIDPKSSKEITFSQQNIMITSKIISAFTTLENVTEGYNNLSSIPESKNNIYSNNTLQPYSNETTSPITNSPIISLTKTEPVSVDINSIVQNIPYSILDASQQLGPTPSLTDLNTYNANLLYYLQTQSKLQNMTSVTTPANNSIIIQNGVPP